MADTGATGQIPEVVHIDAVEEAVAPVNAAVKGEPVDAQAQNPLKRGAEATEDDGPDAKRLHVAQLEQNGESAAAAVQVAVAPEAAVPAAAEVKVEEVAAGTDAAAQPAAEVAVKAEEAAAPQDVVATGQPAEASEGAAQRSSKPASGVELGSFKLPADACLKQEIPLPRRMASCVIGIKGQSVTKLRRDSGSKIHVRPSVTREELDQVVEIEGSIESVLTCVRMIGDLLRAEDPSFAMKPKPNVTSKFLVLPEMIGPAIIGKGGTHAKHIKERTGVRIEVVPAQTSQSRQEIVLHGAAERVREAYHLLLGNIRKYGPSNLPAGAVPNPLPFNSRAGAGRGDPGAWRPGREAYSPSGRGAYAGAGRPGAPPPPPPRGGAPPPYRYDYAPPPAAYPPADPYRAPPVAAAPYAAPAAPAAAPTYAAADPNAAAGAAAAGGQQMMYILQDGVLKPLTVMYQGAGAATAAAPAAAAPVAQTAVVPTGYAAAPAATTYGTAQAAAPAAAPASTGATNVYQQAAATTQYTYAVPSTDASGAATAAWTVATSAPLAAAPATYTTAAGYGAQATTQYATAAAPAATQYYYQPQ